MLRRLLISIIIIVIILAVVLFYTTQPYNNYLSNQSFGQSILINTSTLTIFYLALSIVTYLAAITILISLLLRLIRLAYQAIWGVNTSAKPIAKSVFGENPMMRVIAFAIATILFSDVLVDIIHGIISFSIALISQTPRELYDQAGSILSSCNVLSDPALFSRCLTDFGLGFLRTWIDVLQNSYDASNFQLLDFTRLLYFFVTWIICGLLLSYLIPESVTGRKKVNNLQDLSNFLASTTVRNTLFFVIVVIGSYLSLVAIISIPLLQQDTTGQQDVSVERLAQEIAQVQTQRTPASLYDSETVDPFTELAGFIELRLKPMTETTPEPVIEGTTEVQGSSSEAVSEDNPTPILPPQDSQLLSSLYAARDVMATYQFQRADLLKTYSALSESTPVSIANDGDQVVDTYRTETSNRPGSRENIRFYLTVLTWYRSQVKTNEERLRQCTNAVREADQSWTHWAAQVKEVLENPLREEPTRFSQNFRYSASEDDADIAFNICGGSPALRRPVTRISVNGQVTAEVADNPLQRPSLGSFSGAFGVIARWLLDSESLELALIVGLIGFGILGAAASRFVNEQRQGRSNKLLVEDLSGVMLRGVVAAILVFLLAKSGLGIYDSGTSGTELHNPYLILVFCLIAGIYSEVVWAWAQEYIKKQLPPPAAEGAVATQLPLETIVPETPPAASGSIVIETTEAASSDVSGEGTSNDNAAG